MKNKSKGGDDEMSEAGNQTDLYNPIRAMAKEGMATENASKLNAGLVSSPGRTQLLQA